MSVPDIDILRADAADLIQRAGPGINEAIIAGAMAAFNVGSPLSSTASAQSLITKCQPLIEQANRDVLSIQTREFLKMFEVILAGTGGSGTPGAPSAPFLTGTISVADLVELDWTNVANETGYSVYYSTDNANYQLLVALGADVIDLTETRDNSAGLYYKVLAVNASGNSPYSNVVNLSPPPATYTYRYGKSANTVLNEAQILALSTRTGSTPSGNYVYGTANEYAFLAVPITSSAPSFMRVDGLELDLAGAAEGYASTTNLLTHTLVTVSGVSHRLYRSLNQLPDAFTVVVS